MLPREVDLCVVGAGPVGLAALYEARLCGIDAIAVERTDQPVTSIHRHVEGLVYQSDARHFEVAGLPVDCGDSSQCTREDVLSYYARVIHHGRLRIHYRTECVDLEPVGDHVRVVLNTEGDSSVLTARRVVLTNWFRMRKFECARTSSHGCLEVLHGVQPAARLAGRRVVVFGGGLSAVEQVALLMNLGHRVILLLRSARGAIHRHPAFERLIHATGSEILDGVKNLRLEGRRVFCERNGASEHVDADVLVFAGGAQVNGKTVSLVERRGLVSNDLARELCAIAPPEGLSQRVDGPDDSNPQLRIPDLWTYLFSGCRGVHFCGGILHRGTYKAGIAVSIGTARLAVRAIAGERVPKDWRPPLPTLLQQPEFLAWLATVRDWASFDEIRPLAVTSLSRHWPLRKVTLRPLRPNEYVLGEHSPLDAELLALADGQSTVAQLARRSGIAEEWQREELRDAFRDLFYRNALTWMPSRWDVER